MENSYQTISVIDSHWKLLSSQFKKKTVFTKVPSFVQFSCFKTSSLGTPAFFAGDVADPSTMWFKGFSIKTWLFHYAFGPACYGASLCSSNGLSVCNEKTVYWLSPFSKSLRFLMYLINSVTGHSFILCRNYIRYWSMDKSWP